MTVHVPLRQRPLRIGPASSAVLDRLYEQVADNIRGRTGQDELTRLLTAIDAETHRLAADHDAEFPPDPPNDSCHFALIDGYYLTNGTLPTMGCLRPYLDWGNENILLWTPERDRRTVLISDVTSPAVAQGIWKPFGLALSMIEAISSTLESLIDVEYRWIYRFDNAKSLKDQDWLDPDDAVLGPRGGTIRAVRYLYDYASALDLMWRDDKYFSALQDILVAAKNHWFCQECAIRPPEARRHPNHEPRAWDMCAQLPRMEVAIVQATRAVERLLGKPGRNESRVLNRWGDAVSIAPRDTFPCTQQTYLEYYYELFDLRGRAAHGLGGIPFNISRLLTIQAQSFAWLIVASYFDRHSNSHDISVANLNFNRALVMSEPLNWSTELTAESRDRLRGLSDP